VYRGEVLLSDHFQDEVNNQEAFRVLFDMFYDRVYRTAYYITKDRFLAQDVLQETFLKAFRNIEDVTDGSKLGAWLTVIATNTAIDSMRKRSRWNGIPTDDVILLNKLNRDNVANSVETQVDIRIEKEQIMLEMKKLTPENRQILLLKYEQELKDEEIAVLLGLNVGTIKSRVHRAKNYLRKILRIADSRDEENNGMVK
jgi:RNA polymerase sigma factor (sigma-70 family)